jgi:tripartite-type tricarboxylate transporter receptor subunit TctC
MKKLLLILLLSFSSVLYAKETVKIVISAAPGGTADKIARVMQTDLASNDYNFILEYKLGAAGIVGANYVAEEKTIPTILVVSLGLITNADAPQVKYNLQSDFSHIRCVVVEPVFILVNSNSSIKTFNDFTAASLRQPMPYSTFGAGSTGTIIAEHFFTHPNYFAVPFKGGAEIINAVVSDTVVWTIEAVHATKTLVEADRLRAIAVNSSKRLSEFPNVPTFKELGLNDQGFKRMQLVALNSAVKGDLKEHIIKKLNNFNLQDNTVQTCPQQDNFVASQQRIYKNFVR